MSLDLGGLVGRVVLDTALFDRAYARVVRQMASLGTEAGTAAAGTAKLDESMAAIGGSSDAAAAGMGRAAKAAQASSAAESKAAAAATRHAEATARVAAVMADSEGMTSKQTAAQLRAVAAQDRLVAAQESGTASTRQLASAQAGLIAAEDRATTAHRGNLAALARTAGQLGIAVGAYEAVKKAIDIGREAAAYQSDMTRIRTLTGASVAEVKRMSTALLGLSGQVATAPDKLANSLYHVESIGLRGAKALDVVRVAAEGAKIGNANLEETTNALTSTIASGVAKGQSFAATMSQLLTIVGTGDLKLSDFNESLSSGLLTILANAGVSLKDAGAALAVFGDSNIRGAHAATMLRVAVQALQAGAKGGQKALDLIGLSASSLRDDLQKGGLNLAITDLRAHLDAAGDSGKKSGAIIVEAFGKRANAGISVLVNEYSRLQTKYGDLDHGALTFGQRWDATQKTASFAFSRIGAEADAAGIRIANKLLPAASAVAVAVGTGIPHAAAFLGTVLAPLVRVGGAVFTGLAVGAKGAGVAIEAIGHVLAPLEPILKLTGSAALGMWLGFQAGRAVVAIVGAVGTGIEAMSAKAATARLSIMSLASSWTDQGAAATAAAAESGIASASIADEAAATSGAVVVAGDAARIGWAGLAGPIGAAVVGVGVIISMFHKSSTASKEATDAAKAYSDALSSGGKSDLVDSITTQLKNNDLPAELAKLNVGLKGAAITGKQFVDAVELGGQPLDALRARLEGIIKAAGGYLPPNVEAAVQALKHLNTEYGALTKTAQKDLVDTKTFAGASSSITKLSTATQVGSDTAKTYAEMVGIAVDKNGIAAVSAKALNTAVNSVAHAFGTANQTGNEFLAAVNTFAGSAGTAADRAALIGATLKAANGDALNFVAQMNAAATADTQFAADVASSAKTAGKSTGDFLASIIDLKTGTINYSKSAAGPLISDLQSMQTAAMNAAQAQYQHAKATHSGAVAADEAYKVYQSNTSGALAAEASKLGLTAAQAKKLADQYFGMPKNVKTLIEQEGANPIVNVLNKIGTQLSYLTGHRWTATVAANTGATQSKLNQIVTTMRTIGQGANAVVNITTVNKATHATSTVKARATGGPITGPGGPTSDSVPIMASNGEYVVNARAYARNKNLVNAINNGGPGFATGGAVGSTPAQRAALARLRLTIDTSDISRFLQSLGGSASAIGSAERALANAVTSAGGNSALAHELNGENSTLVRLATDRTGIANRLKKANTALAAVQKQWADEKTAVATAITGSFDITQAGFTGTQIQANLDATVKTARTMSAQAARLQAIGLNKNVLADLEAKGTSAAPTIAALSGDSKAQITALNNGYRALGMVGNTLGGQAANTLYGAGVQAAKGLVAGLTSQERTLAKTMTHLADVMVGQIRHDLKMHSPSKVGFDLGANFADSKALGIRSKYGTIRRAAQGMSTAAVQPGAGMPAGGMVPPIHLTVNPQPYQSEAEIGQIAAAKVAFALMSR